MSGVATVATATFVGAGAGAGWRAGRLRLAAVGAAGSYDGGVAGRLEVSAAFLLVPLRRRGVGVYGGGGVAGTRTRAGGVERVVLFLGIETRPGGPRGWFLEGGVAGGVRFAAGLRWRSLTRR